MQTGLIKINNDYLNPTNIVHIGKNSDGTTCVTYNTLASGPNGIAPTSDNIPVDSDKLARCAVKAMNTGEIVDVMV